ncbi:pyrroline-5-carboxylate reductase [Actinomycetota bacterium]
MSTIAIFGAGAMGEAVIAGLTQAGGHDIVIVEPREERAAELVERYGVTSSDVAGAAGADTVLLVVKPYDVAGLLGQLKEHLSPDALVISLAAGVTTEALEAPLSDGQPVARVMPNTPALIGQGMAAVSPGRHATAEHVARAREVLGACGEVVDVPEKQQDAVTALSGSGPAYLFYVADALIEGGVLEGLPRETARELAVQTLYGAAAMLKETGEHPAVLRERVSSPAGTTMAGLRELDLAGVRAALVSAVAAAAERSRELGRG